MTAVVNIPCEGTLNLAHAWTFPRMRALAWSGDLLYASHEYTVYSARFNTSSVRWSEIGRYHPRWWRNCTCHNDLACRLFRDGFHALAILPNGNLVGAVPGAIVTLRLGQTRFEVSHRIERGTRPLHISVTSKGSIFWGEYFDNRQRSEVHIYGSADGGLSWRVVHTFAAGQVRHVHNIVYDERAGYFYVLTGDYGKECQILIASCDFKMVHHIIGGSQQARAVAAIPSDNGLYFASDTPTEHNFIYHIDNAGKIRQLAAIPSSCVDGCRNRVGMFFSAMAEPSRSNDTKYVSLIGSLTGENWRILHKWPKDRWPMKLFQYGTLFFPAGENDSDLLAVSTIAVQSADLQTTIFRTSVT